MLGYNDIRSPESAGAFKRRTIKGPFSPFFRKNELKTSVIGLDSELWERNPSELRTAWLNAVFHPAANRQIANCLIHGLHPVPVNPFRS